MAIKQDKPGTKTVSRTVRKPVKKPASKPRAFVKTTAPKPKAVVQTKKPVETAQKPIKQDVITQKELPEIPVTPEPQVDLSELQKKPFMAKQLTAKGEPWYGSGFKGWARRTFAYIFDPDTIAKDATAEDWKNIESYSTAYERTNLGILWDTNMAGWTGITAKDVGMVFGSIKSDQEKYDEAGAIKAFLNGAQLPWTIAKNMRSGRNLMFQISTPLMVGENYVRKTFVAPFLAGREVGKPLETVKYLYFRGLEGKALKALGVNVELSQDFTEMLKVYQGGKGAAYTFATNQVISDLSSGGELSKFLTNLDKFAHMSILDAADRLYGDKIPPIVRGFIAFSDDLRASAFSYDSWLENTRRDMFLQRARDGEDPDFLALEYANPVPEIIGGVLFDPLNLLGMGGARKASSEALGQATKFFDISPELTKSFQSLFKYADDAPEATTALRVIQDHVINIARRSEAKLTKFGTEFGINVLTTRGKQDAVFNVIHDVMSIVARGSRSVDEFAETVGNIVKIGSRNQDEARKAIEALLHSPSARAIFSEGGMDAATVVRRIYGEGKLIDEIKAIKNVGGGVGDMANWFDHKLLNAVDDMFPTFDDMEKAFLKSKKGAELVGRESELAKAFTKINNSKFGIVRDAKNTFTKYMDRQPGIVRGVNQFFASVYMGYSPGYAIRNLQNNFITVLADSGPVTAVEAAVAGGKEVLEPAVKFIPTWIRTGFDSAIDSLYKPGSHVIMRRKQIEAMLNFIPASALGKGRSIVTAADVGTNITEGMTAMQKVKQLAKAPVITASERVELGFRVEVMYQFAQREMGKFIRSNAWLPDTTELLAKGFTNDDLDLISKLIYSTNGNVNNVRKFMEKGMSQGFVEEWRVMNPAKKAAQWMKDSGIWDDMMAYQRNAPSPAEFKKYATMALDDFTERLVTEASKESPQFAMHSIARAEGDDLVEIDRLFKDSVIGNEERDFLQSSLGFYQEAERKCKDSFQQLYGQVSKDWSPNNAYVIWKKTEGGLSTLAYEENRNFNKFVRDIIGRVGKEDSAKLVDESVFNLGGKEVRLSFEGTPTPETLKNALWNWYFTESGVFWKDIFSARVGKWKAGIDELGALVKHKADFTEVDDVLARAQAYGDAFVASRSNAELKGLSKIPKGTTLDKIDPYYQRVYLNRINAERERMGLEKITDLKTVTVDELIGATKKKLVRGMMPDVPGRVTPLRSQAQAAENMSDSVKKWIDSVVNNWGKTTTKFADDAQKEVLERFLSELDSRFTTAKLTIGNGSSRMADFALLDYNKYGGDVLTSYIYPYAYWYTRTFPNWLKRLTQNPLIFAEYAKYRKFMETLHAGLPEWWKYNLSTNDLPGIDTENPLFFNLEAGFNPLNTLMGVDFDDPYKEVDWLSRIVSDMGKSGPTVHSILNYLVAAELYVKAQTTGENKYKEASRRWMGRLFPQSSTIKSALNAAKIDIGTPYNEVDPYVLAFSGGLDPYEEARAARYLYTLVDMGKISPEQAEEAKLLHDNGQVSPEWDKAVAESLGARAMPNFMSWFFGTGYKPRTKTDMEIDKFYNTLYTVNANKSNMDAREYRAAMNTLFEQYKGGSALLMTKKSGVERDSAFAYSILQRVPPGDLSAILTLHGVSYDTYQKFYEGKGTFEGINPADKMSFMAMIYNVSALYQLPDYATRDEWNEAKSTYQTLLETGAQMFKPVGSSATGGYFEYAAKGGMTIWDEVDYYMGIEDTKARRDFEKAHPEVLAAMQWKDSAIMGTPLLYRYYGSLETVYYYYKDEADIQVNQQYPNFEAQQEEYFRIYDNVKNEYLKTHPWIDELQLEEDKLTVNINSQYGVDIEQLVTDYYATPTAQRKAFKYANPALAAYWDAQKKIPDIVNARHPGIDVEKDRSAYYALDSLKKQYEEAHPDFVAAREYRKRMRAAALNKAIRFAEQLPRDKATAAPRPDVQMTPIRSQMLDVTTPVGVKPPEYYQQAINNPPVWRLVMDYIANGAEIPTAGMNILDDVAFDLNVSTDMLLMLITQSVSRPTKD